MSLDVPADAGLLCDKAARAWGHDKINIFYYASNSDQKTIAKASSAQYIVPL
jgi:hypothetical protein